MGSPIYLCVLVTTLPCCDKLPWKTVWWDEHSDWLDHEDVIERWEGWALYPNNDMETWPPVATVENQRPPMEKNLLL